mmetsp:Transcript_56457/g.122769  ORF Transcript_56457/g.122769 Transcript_56457/m.122769 type:complete len:127 (+) Transcript_56457:588-968(+)
MEHQDDFFDDRAWLGCDTCTRWTHVECELDVGVADAASLHQALNRKKCDCLAQASGLHTAYMSFLVLMEQTKPSHYVVLSSILKLVKDQWKVLDEKRVVNETVEKGVWREDWLASCLTHASFNHLV